MLIDFLKRKINYNAFIIGKKSIHTLPKSKQVEVTDFLLSLSGY